MKHLTRASNSFRREGPPLDALVGRRLCRRYALEGIGAMLKSQTIKFISVLLLLMPSFVGAASDITIEAPGKKISLSSEEWEKLADPAGFAKNVSERKLEPSHKFSRVVTVFLNLLTEDRYSGMLKISEHEYIEVFVVHPGFITAEVVVDKGTYWVLSRETYLPKKQTLVNISQYKPVLNQSDTKSLWLVYQQEIDETRYLLSQKF